MANISVLLCAYKEPLDQFEQAVRSVVSQTLMPKQLVIVDDSGKHRYQDRCAVLQNTLLNEKHINMTYIGNHKNLGLVSSLNAGLEQVNYDYVARMDADDISLPFRFQKQAELLDEGSDIVGSGVTLFSENGEIRNVIYPVTRLGVLHSLLRNNPIAHPAAMFRKDVASKLDGYHSVNYAEDLDFWMRAFLQGYHITNSRSVLLLRRIHDQQLSSQFNKEQLENTKVLRRYFLRHLLRAYLNA